MSTVRLYINIDHVATVRQARRGAEPDPVAAAILCEDAGADGITAHLREDRRHIQDEDIHRLARSVRTVLNLEMACTEEMVELALRLQPHQVTLVPERREEITTEGGLDVSAGSQRIGSALRRLRDAKVRTSVFIAPDPDAVRRSVDLGAHAVELHTGPYAHSPGGGAELDALRRAAAQAATSGTSVHAGHGLTVANIAAIVAIPEVEEVNIGHSIVSRAIFIGLRAAVEEMKKLTAARAAS